MMIASPGLRFGSSVKLVKHEQQEGGQPLVVLELGGGGRKARLAPQTRLTFDGDQLYIDHQRVAPSNTRDRNKALLSLMEARNFKRLKDEVERIISNYFAGHEDTADGAEQLLRH